MARKTSEKNVRASFCFYATWTKSWPSLLIKRNRPGNTDLQSNTLGFEWFKALLLTIFLPPSCSPNWKDKVWDERFLPTRNSDIEKEMLLLG